MIETAMREGSHYFEWTHMRIGGEEFPATVLLTRMEHASKVFLQATVRDITERKKAEQDLRQAMKELEQANSRLEAAADRANQMAVRSSRATLESRSSVKSLALSHLPNIYSLNLSAGETGAGLAPPLSISRLQVDICRRIDSEQTHGVALKQGHHEHTDGFGRYSGAN